MFESLTRESIVLISLCAPKSSLFEGTGVSEGDMDVLAEDTDVSVVGAVVGVTSDGFLPTQPRASTASRRTNIIYAIFILILFLPSTAHTEVLFGSICSITV